jgi:hypothetical protein
MSFSVRIFNCCLNSTELYTPSDSHGSSFSRCAHVQRRGIALTADRTCFRHDSVFCFEELLEVPGEGGG